MTKPKRLRDARAAALKKIPQLRAHHVQRRGWNPEQPHLVPLLGDVRHETARWVVMTPTSVEHATMIFKGAKLPRGVRHRIVEHQGRAWILLTAPKPFGRDALAKALGTAGTNPVLDVRRWYPADDPLYAKHVKEAFR